MKLTAQQIEVFRSEGWLFLPEVFDAEEISLLKAEAEAIYRQHRPEVWREKSGAPRTAFAAHTYSEPFRVLGAHPRLILPVEQIFGEKALPVQKMQRMRHRLARNAELLGELILGDALSWQ